MSKIFFSSNIFANPNSLQNKAGNIIIDGNEIGYNVLLFKNNIVNPPKSEERKNIFLINTDNILMPKINIKDSLSESDIIIIPNSANGNCFYKSISQFYYNKEIYHIYFRKTIAEYIELNKQEECIKYPYIYKNEHDILTWHEYFNELILTGCYAEEYEIINASKIYNCNFIIYKNANYNYNDQNYNFVFETIINQNEHSLNPFKPIILLGWVNNNHYVLLLPKNTNLELTPIEFRNNLNKNSEKNKNEKLLKNNKISNLDNNKEDSNINEDISKKKKDNDQLNIQFKNYLSNYVKNDSSDFPVIKGVKNGETRLQDIYNYLESEIINPYNKKWPQYIEEVIKELEREKKNKVSYEKIKKKTNKIKNLKKDFRNSAKHYILSQKKELLYKRKLNTTKEKEKGSNDEILYLKVPNKEELNKLLYDLHANQFHCNYLIVQNSFKQKRIGYYGINSLIEEYVSNCPVCVQTSRTIHRLDPVKPININGPNYRYEFDITYLNPDLQEAYDVKMLLSIIDVFSRKAMIYKLNDKKSDTIIQYILEFCANNTFPKEFCSDNGPEFKNSKLNDICEREGITFIHGIPYNPHSQGTVERFHYTIKKYLGKEYINNGYKKLNFDEVRIKIINFYNNKKHRLIGMSPLEASRITDPDTIKRINDLKSKEFANINKKRTYLEKNTTCLLNPKLLVIGKKTLIPNFVKKGKIQEKIPVRIMDNASFGYYHIKIFKNYKAKKINLRKGDEYIADSKLLKKVSEKTWKAIINKKN